ncbi:unnamed protein product, partial [Laminaria digitata]
MYESCSGMAMEPYPPRVWRNFDGIPRGNSRRALATRVTTNQHSASGVEVYTPFGAVSSRGSLFSFSVCSSCRCIERLMMRRCIPVLPGRGQISTLPRGATSSARWLHKPQPISNLPERLGLPQRTGQDRPHGSP